MRFLAAAKIRVSHASAAQPTLTEPRSAITSRGRGRPYNFRLRLELSTTKEQKKCPTMTHMDPTSNRMPKYKPFRAEFNLQELMSAGLPHYQHYLIFSPALISLCIIAAHLKTLAFRVPRLTDLLDFHRKRLHSR